MTTGFENKCHGGTPDASSENAGTYTADQAFDEVYGCTDQNSWANSSGQSPSWIGYQFASAEKINNIIFVFCSGFVATDYQFEATNDLDANWNDRTWSTLASYTDGAVGTMDKDFSNDTAYQTYRIKFTGGFTDANDIVNIQEVEMYHVFCGTWSTDKFTGGTANASSDFGANYVASKAFDDLLGFPNYWLAAAFDTPSWVGYEFASAELIKRVDVRFRQSYATDYRIEGTNDTDGDWDLRTWTTLNTSYNGINDTTRVNTFENSTAYKTIRVKFTGGYVDGGGQDKVSIEELECFTCEDINQDDSFSFDDSFTAHVPFQPDQDDSFSFDDSFAAEKDQVPSQWSAFTIDDTFDAESFKVRDYTDQFNFDDVFSATNISNLFNQFADIAVSVFYFTLTGFADFTSNVTIPISSFQARHRSAEPSYLSVVIPGVQYASEINARSNGSMIIEQAYIVDDLEFLRQEIFRADLEDISIFEGGRNRSITLTGHKTLSYVQKSVTLDRHEYKATENGKFRVRFPYIDPFVRPGDLVTVETDTFEVGYISMSVTVGRRVMEIVEVG